MAQSNGKLASLADAAELARGAARVALGGWSFSRRPLAIAMHWAAHGLRFDELLVLTGGVETDLLVAAGFGDVRLLRNPMPLQTQLIVARPARV